MTGSAHTAPALLPGWAGMHLHTCEGGFPSSQPVCDRMGEGIEGVGKFCIAVGHWHWGGHWNGTAMFNTQQQPCFSAQVVAHFLERVVTRLQILSSHEGVTQHLPVVTCFLHWAVIQIKSHWIFFITDPSCVLGYLWLFSLVSNYWVQWMSIQNMSHWVQ